MKLECANCGKVFDKEYVSVDEFKEMYKEE